LRAVKARRRACGILAGEARSRARPEATTMKWTIDREVLIKRLLFATVMVVALGLVLGTRLVGA
jgi:hypothetical protein